MKHLLINHEAGSILSPRILKFPHAKGISLRTFAAEEDNHGTYSRRGSALYRRFRTFARQYDTSRRIDQDGTGYYSILPVGTRGEIFLQPYQIDLTPRML